MRNIIVFDLVTVDGFFCGPNGEIDWMKTDDEFQKFSEEQTGTFGAFIFGHTTYDLMHDYWSTPEALKSDPVVTNLMRETWKLVFSKTLIPVENRPEWKHVKILRDIGAEEIRGWKKMDGKDIAIFGSGTIIQQMANLGLIDEYRLLVNPLILGKGKPLFKDVRKTDLELAASRTFGNGNILLAYRPAAPLA